MSGAPAADAGPQRPWALLADLLLPLLRPGDRVALGGGAPGLRHAVAAAGHDVTALAEEADGVADAVVVPDVTVAGGEVVLAEAVRALRPRGLLLACAPGVLHGGMRAHDLARAVGHFGVAAELTVAPGVSALLRGRPPSLQLDTDREPGLLDAGPLVAVAGRLASSQAERSRTFFDTLPRKVVAAAVCCRDDEGRLLVVEDLFKQHWTIPGGVVDTDEPPGAAARREALEEAGVTVRIDRLIGVFSASRPDRISFIFQATPVPQPSAAAAADDPQSRPRTHHPHEIGAVAWVPWEEALDRIAPYISEQLRLSTANPGGIWPQ